MSQNRRSQSLGDNGKSGTNKTQSKDDSVISYKSGKKYQAAKSKKLPDAKTKMSKKFSKSMDHLNVLKNNQLETSKVRTYPEIVTGARKKLPVLEQRYLRQISSAPEEQPTSPIQSPLTSRTYKKDAEILRQISSAPEGHISSSMEDLGIGNGVIGHISPRDLITSTPKEMDLCSSRRSYTQVTPKNKFLQGVTQGVGAENTLSSIHSEPSVADIMKTGVNRPKTQGFRRDQTFISNGSNLSSTAEGGDESDQDKSKRGKRSISSRGSTIRYRDRTQVGSKVAGLKKDKTPGRKVVQSSKFRPKATESATKGQSSQIEEVNALEETRSSSSRHREITSVETEEPKASNDMIYESLPSRENTLVPDADDDLEIGEEAKDITKKEQYPRDSENAEQLDNASHLPKLRKNNAKEKKSAVQSVENVTPSKGTSAFTIVPPIRGAEVSETVETSSNMVSVITNDSLASTNLGDSLLTENESSKEDDKNTDISKGKITADGKSSSKTAGVKRKPSQKKVRPYYSKVNNSKHVSQKIKKADSFLKIEGKPPIGARPRSARLGLNYTHRSKQSAESELLPKSAEANTIGRPVWRANKQWSDAVYFAQRAKIVLMHRCCKTNVEATTLLSKHSIKVS